MCLELVLQTFNPKINVTQEVKEQNMTQNHKRKQMNAYNTNGQKSTA